MDKKLIISPTRSKWIPAIELHAEDIHLPWTQIAERTGISYHTIKSWTRVPEFMDACYKRFMEIHGNKAEFVVMAIYDEAVQGNMKAAELWLKYTGRYVDKKVYEHAPGDQFIDWVNSRDKEVHSDIEEAEIVQDPMLEVQNKVHAKVHTPSKVHATIKEENERIEKTKKKYNKKYKVNKDNRNALMRLKRRAKKVGLKSMGLGRPSKTEKAIWVAKLEKLEKKKGIKPPSP